MTPIAWKLLVWCRAVSLMIVAFSVAIDGPQGRLYCGIGVVGFAMSLIVSAVARKRA